MHKLLSIGTQPVRVLASERITFQADRGPDLSHFMDHK